MSCMGFKVIARIIGKLRVSSTGNLNCFGFFVSAVCSGDDGEPAGVCGVLLCAPPSLRW